MGIYDYVIKNGKGEDVPMSDYKGKVLLIVNTMRNITTEDSRSSTFPAISSRDRLPSLTKRSTSSARSNTTHSSPR